MRWTCLCSFFFSLDVSSYHSSFFSSILLNNITQSWSIFNILPIWLLFLWNLKISSSISVLTHEWKSSWRFMSSSLSFLSPIRHLGENLYSNLFLSLSLFLKQLLKVTVQEEGCLKRNESVVRCISYSLMFLFLYFSRYPIAKLLADLDPHCDLVINFSQEKNPSSINSSTFYSFKRLKKRISYPSSHFIMNWEDV